MRVIGWLGLFVAGAFAACGGSTDAGPIVVANDGGAGAGDASGNGNDAAGGRADAATTSDATPPVEAGSEYPAPHFPIPVMKNYGGPVIADPKIITVTFAGDVDRDAKRAFDDVITAGPWWDAVTRGWGIHRGSGGVYVELPDTVSNQTLDNDADLVPMLRKLVTDGKLPPPNANTLYALYFPQSTHITLLGHTSCAGFGAYHDYAHFTVNGQDVMGAFAIMPKCRANGFSTVAASHEFIEAVTDPHPFTTKLPPDNFTWYLYDDAWAVSGAGGGEVADYCEAANTATEGQYTVTRSWVNAAAAASKDPCQPSDPGVVYYNTAVESEKVTGLSDPWGGPDYESGGYLVVTAGATKTANAVVFSEAALPHDVTLLVGKQVANSNDPSQIAPIAAGVTAALSTTTGKNGTKVTLTITTSATTPKRDYRFLVRSILDTSTGDYNEWPLVLRVN